MNTPKLNQQYKYNLYLDQFMYFPFVNINFYTIVTVKFRSGTSKCAQIMDLKKSIVILLKINTYIQIVAELSDFLRDCYWG